MSEHKYKRHIYEVKNMKRQKKLKKYMKILEELKIEEPTKNSF